jgi:probable F420-dependent oxidoreductase
VWGIVERMDRTFRFGVVAAGAQDGRQWSALAQRVEELGYAILLTPDNLSGISPLPALAAAAAATSTLRVGSYVLAAPYRSPAQVAWDTAAMAALSDGRFELGIGAGRPAAAGEAELLGREFGRFDERVAEVAATIHAVKERVPSQRVLVAGSGRRLLELAAAQADSIAIGLGPEADEAALIEKVGVLRELAGPGADDIELNVNLLAVGDETPPWLRQHIGLDVADLAARGSAAVLTGSVSQMADRLQRRRDAAGISYVVTNAGFMDALAPVVRRLAGT